VAPPSWKREHDSLIAMIIERTVLHKADLFWFFINASDTRDGLVRSLAPSLSWFVLTAC
jgi:hypothetical protein